MVHSKFTSYLIAYFVLWIQALFKELSIINLLSLELEKKIVLNN